MGIPGMFRLPLQWSAPSGGAPPEEPWVHPAVSCSGGDPSPVARTYPRTGKSAGNPRPYRT